MFIREVDIKLCLSDLWFVRKVGFGDVLGLYVRWEVGGLGGE